MKVTKFGHCCLLVEEKGVRVLTDPGNFTTAQNEVKDIDIILITHEHADHLHVESLKIVLGNNPDARVVTNESVAKILEKEGFKYEIVTDGGKISDPLLIEGVGEKHAIIYREYEQVENTGYFIENKLFYPGDALTDPKRPVDTLCLPVVAPWLKISEAIDYARALKPKQALPVHDGNVKSAGIAHRLPKMFLEKDGIAFLEFELGQEYEI